MGHFVIGSLRLLGFLYQAACPDPAMPKRSKRRGRWGIFDPGKKSWPPLPLAVAVSSPSLRLSPVWAKSFAAGAGDGGPQGWLGDLGANPMDGAVGHAHMEAAPKAAAKAR
jgi:hypothetical protein